MNVTLWMAMSLNGMTAREDGSEDFLSGTDWELFLDLVRASDALVWGRITHDLFESQVRAHAPDLPIVAVTRDPAYAVGPGSLTAPSPADAVEVLRRKGAAEILLAGGSQLNGAFVQAGLVDTVVVAIEPVIVAHGLPLVRGAIPDLRLRLVSVDQIDGHTMRLRYAAQRDARR